MKFISAIVPVFNEEKTVAGVIKALLKSPLINEVICINDGSTDKSLAILKKFKDKIQLLDFKVNKGKGFVLVAGMKRAKGELVAFFDADLTNLSDDHIKTLFKPILEGKFKAVLGYPTKGENLADIVFSSLTGERLYYKKDLVPYFEKMAKTRFGVEIFLNEIFNKKETKKIPLKNLIGLLKYEKRKPLRAFKEYLSETMEIAWEIGRREGLLPEDRHLIKSLANVVNAEELNKRIRKIRNLSVRQFLKKYVLGYIKKAQSNTGKYQGNGIWQFTVIFYTHGYR